MENTDKKSKKEKKDKKKVQHEEVPTESHTHSDDPNHKGMSEMVNTMKGLSVGSDLTKIKMGASVQLPLSGLQITRNNSCVVNNYLIKANSLEDPADRMLQIANYLMFCLWPPKFGKKPLNPILGENSTVFVNLPDGSRTTHIVEQVSHHPPISVAHLENEQNQISSLMSTEVAVSFWGTYVLIRLEKGQRNIHLGKFQENYEIEKLPNLYVRIFRFHGEFNDKMIVKCPETGIVCEVKYKSKPLFGGKWDEVKGTIHKGSEVFYELKGVWSDEVTVTNMKTKQQTIWNYKTKETVDFTFPEELDELSSEKIWGKFGECLNNGNIKEADEIKNAIEEKQRVLVKERQKNNEVWKPKYFDISAEGKYIWKGK